jgi:predicted DNA-binding protein with PD1-like motif
MDVERPIKNMHNLIPSTLYTYSVRLRPGDDIKTALDSMCKDYHITAGCILSCVGSLNKLAVRFANQPEVTIVQGPLEIVSLTGTLSESGSHLHISCSDKIGSTIGGHLKEGNEIYTTAEIVIGVLADVNFTREKDDTYGYNELVVRPKK